MSIRDGNQSLWGATRFPTRQILQIAPVLDRVGLRAVDFTSSTHMGIAVRNHRENPWERIRRTHAAMPHTPLQFITGFRFISWEMAHPDFMKLVYERLVANGISRFALLDPMHEMTNLLSSAKAINEAGGEVVAALIYTLSEVHDDAYYAGLAKQMANCPSIDRVYIKDPAGLLTPERARTLVPALVAALDGKPLELHSHTTVGLSPRTYVLVPDLGIEVVQTACGPLSNGSSLPDVHRVVSNLRAMGHTVDVDDRLLGVVAEYFTRIALAERLPFGTPQEFDAAFLQHQLAGGTLTTTMAAAHRARPRAAVRRVDRRGDQGSGRARLPDHGHPVPADRRPAGAVEHHRRGTLRDRVRSAHPLRPRQLRPTRGPDRTAGAGPHPGAAAGQGD